VQIRLEHCLSYRIFAEEIGQIDAVYVAQRSYKKDESKKFDGTSYNAFLLDNRADDEPGAQLFELDTEELPGNE